MDYKKKFLMFKKLIYKHFSDYEKNFFFNISNNTYQVHFVLKDSILILTILPDSEWREFKKKIEKKISIFTSNTPECQICFNQTDYVAYCRQCSFKICLDCFRKLNNGLFCCPQCRRIPHTREYDSGIRA